MFDEFFDFYNDLIVPGHTFSLFFLIMLIVFLFLFFYYYATRR